MTCLAFVPTFRNMRLFAIWALIGTTYTSWYMIGTSIHAGVHNSVNLIFKSLTPRWRSWPCADPFLACGTRFRCCLGTGLA